MRGFAVKLYSQDGNSDLVGNNIPVLFIQDAIKFSTCSIRPSLFPKSCFRLFRADQMIDGEYSVLYDAVALLPSKAGIDDLLAKSTARDFVADAFAHCKFIGHAEAATPLFAKAGIYDLLDEGVIAFASPNDIAAFIEKLGELRSWSREPSVRAR